MDLRAAVAVSMLPVSRSPAAAAFKDVSRHASAASPRQVIEQVLLALHVPAEQREGFAASAIETAESALRAGSACGIVPIGLGDARYPALLSAIADPPPVLWTRGDPAVLHQAIVAVVGSRAATPYALQVGEHLARELSERGMAIASGLARGVDAAAHRGALAGGGPTVAVLGCGVDRVYPAEHAGLAANVSKQGVLVAELAPGAAPLPEHFPLRNRIISGISLAVIIVEASEKSGSLITARCALEQGRDVMAVPGSILTGRNRGSHSLLKDGAKVVETADDILEELGWPGGPVPNSSAKPLISDPLLAKMEAGEVYRLDELMALTGTSGPRLLARLTELELLGLVSAAGMGRFARVVT